MKNNEPLIAGYSGLEGYTGIRGETAFGGHSPRRESDTVWLQRFQFEMDQLRKAQRRARAFLLIIFILSGISVITTVLHRVIC